MSQPFDKPSEDYDTPEEARLDMADWLEKHADKCIRDGAEAMPVPENYRIAAELLRQASSAPSAKAPKIESSREDVGAALRYLHESTAQDGQWADQAVHSFVGAMLKTLPSHVAAPDFKHCLNCMTMDECAERKVCRVDLPQQPSSEAPPMICHVCRHYAGGCQTPEKCRAEHEAHIASPSTARLKSESYTAQDLQGWIDLLEMFSDSHSLLQGAAGEDAMNVGDVLRFIYDLKWRMEAASSSIAPSIPAYYVAVHTGGEPYDKFDFPIADNIGFKASPNGAWMRAHDVMKASRSAMGAMTPPPGYTLVKTDLFDNITRVLTKQQMADICYVEGQEVFRRSDGGGAHG